MKLTGDGNNFSKQQLEKKNHDTNLFWSQTFHVSRFENVLQVFIQINDVGVNRHLQNKNNFNYQAYSEYFY